MNSIDDNFIDLNELSVGRLTRLLAGNCAQQGERDREQPCTIERGKAKEREGKKEEENCRFWLTLYTFIILAFFPFETRGVPQLRPVPPTIPTHPLSY